MLSKDWSEEESARLVRLRAAGLSYRQCGRLLGIPAPQVYWHACKLRRAGPHARALAVVEASLARLRSDGKEARRALIERWVAMRRGGMTFDEIAAATGRSRSLVQKRVAEATGEQRRRLSEDDLARAQALATAGVAVNAIASTLGMSCSGMSRALQRIPPPDVQAQRADPSTFQVRWDQHLAMSGSWSAWSVGQDYRWGDHPWGGR